MRTETNKAENRQEKIKEMKSGVQIQNQVGYIQGMED